MRKVNLLGRFAALRAFEAMYRCDSIAAAADDLGVTQGAISKHIKALEAELGVELFRREGRRSFPTETATKLFEDISPAFFILRQAEENLAQNRSERPFILAAPATTLLRVIIPNAQALQVAIGTRPLQFTTDETQLGATNPAYAIAIRIGRAEQMPPNHFRLADDAFGPVQSPSIAGVVADTPVELLAKGKWLIPADRPNIWTEWVHETGSQIVGNPKQLTLDNMHLALQAAEAGLGLTIAPRPLVKEALRENRLLAPFGFRIRDGGYFAVSHSAALFDRAGRRICRVLGEFLN